MMKMLLSATRHCLFLTVFAITLVGSASFAVKAQLGAPKDSPAQIAFVGQKDGQHSAIFLIDVDSQRQLQLTDSKDNSLFGSWSPDGSQITFTSDRSGSWQIYVMNADGQNVVQLTDLRPTAVNPIWSPDNKYIAFVAYKGETPDIFLMDVKTHSISNLTDNPAYDFLGTWSPDGKRLTFWTTRDETIGLYVTDIAGNEPIPLTKGVHVSPAELNHPVWSPDGTRIAFTGAPQDAKSDLYVIDADGSDLVNLTPDGRTFNLAPTWSPDGQSIAFVSANQQNVAVEKIEVRTGKRSELNSSIKSCRYLAWSPDGQQIACITGGPNVESDIYAMDSDGSNLRQLTFTHTVKVSSDLPPLQWRPR